MTTTTTNARITEALMQLERTRTQLVLRCAGGPAEPGGETTRASADPELVGLLDAAFAEGMADDWIARHPWASIAAGLLAAGLAVSQRRRLMRWAMAHALPWLTSQAAIVAAPMLVQWLERQGAQPAPNAEGSPAGPAEHHPADHQAAAGGAPLGPE